MAFFQPQQLQKFYHLQHLQLITICKQELQVVSMPPDKQNHGIIIHLQTEEQSQQCERNDKRVFK